MLQKKVWVKGREIRVNSLSYWSHLKFLGMGGMPVTELLNECIDPKDKDWLQEQDFDLGNRKEIEGVWQALIDVNPQLKQTNFTTPTPSESGTQSSGSPPPLAGTSTPSTP